MISLIIPTYNEAQSIEETLRRTARALSRTSEPFELIVVDDNSPDGTADLAEALGEPCSVRVVRRSGRAGLATAVLAGWAVAKGDLLGAMDADLQHPPEILSSLSRSLREQDAEIVVASRKVPGGGMRDWSPVRQFISWASTRTAHLLLGDALGGVTDPMSGMFMIKAEVIRGRELRPLGYKILLEVLARGDYSRVEEVAYVFEARRSGASKLGAKQSWEFLAHLIRLSFGSRKGRGQWGYALMGLAGAALNLGLLFLLAEVLQWPRAAAAAAAAEAGLLAAFAGKVASAPQDRKSSPASCGRGGLLALSRIAHSRIGRYHLSRAAGMLLNIAVFLLFSERGFGFLASALTGILVGFLMNFILRFVGIPGLDWRRT